MNADVVTDKPKTNSSEAKPDDKSRMSFGDHLEELRSCLIRALFGLGLSTVLCLVFGKEILAILCRPLFLAQHANGLPAQLQVLAPTAAFTAFLKVGFLGGLVVAMPWVLVQAWRFVSTGLFKHEQRFVKLLIPTSLGLFVGGVFFLYFIVLQVIFNFFIEFNEGFEVPGFAIVAEAPIGQSESVENPLRLPVHLEEPTETQPGDVWIDGQSNRIVVDTGNGLWWIPLKRLAGLSAMQSQFAIDYYVSFVLVLALAFGIAFETPVVVFFLSWTGLVTTAAMARGRHYVVLAIIFLAAVLTPPDVISQLLLALPTYLLFELGIAAARLAERKRRTTDQ